MKFPLAMRNFHGYIVYMLVDRPNILASIERALKRNPVVVLNGPRQCGKTTLARQLLSSDHLNYFDLEDPVSLARLTEPMTALRPLEGLVVIDEVQRLPDLFPILRVLADRRPLTTRFLILGSTSGDLLRQSSESLAGRMERITIGGFSLDEVDTDQSTRLWQRGGFPPAFLAHTEADSLSWRKQFVQTLLERDLPQWGVQVPAVALQRFWTMVAHYHGQTWNSAEPARALGVNESTVRRYLDLLTDALMIRQLQPWHVNLRKRQVKSVKVFVRDTGLLHQLLGIESEKELVRHPKVGASWEGFVIEQILAMQQYDEAYFWATHQGAEMDLVLRRGDKLYGVECKRADAPRITKSIRISLESLGLERIAVVYPGTTRYPIDDRVDVVPLEELSERGTLFNE